MSRTLEPSASSETQARRRLIREWLAIFGANYGRLLSEAQAGIYETYLPAVPVADLKAGFERALRTCGRFPTVADLTRCILAPEKEKREIESLELAVKAERAWQLLEERREEWGLELLPMYSGGKVHHPPELDAPTENALRACGGWERFCSYDPEYYGLMRKQFIEAYGRYEQTGGYKTIGKAEDQKLLAQVQSFAKQLPE